MKESDRFTEIGGELAGAGYLTSFECAWLAKQHTEIASRGEFDERAAHLRRAADLYQASHDIMAEERRRAEEATGVTVDPSVRRWETKGGDDGAL